MDKIIQIRTDRKITDQEMIIIHGFIRNVLLISSENAETKSREGLDEVLCPQ